jgi:hypothetical protein
MTIMKRLLIVIHIIVGLGGLVGGYSAITNPMEPMGAPIEMLKNSPFTDFLIPGLILFFVIGVGNIVSAVLFSRKIIYQGYISSVFSWALVIWIVVQCIMIQDVVFLHVFFFIVGIVQALLSFLLLYEQKLFPSNLVIMLSKKIFKS